MSHSAHIRRLAQILRGFCWRVNLHADLRWPDGRRFSGRCRHARREVEVGCCCAIETLITLAHEAGHALAAARGGPRYHRLSENRQEELAYLYGWGILSALAASLTKAEWREHHRDVLDFGQADRQARSL